VRRWLSALFYRDLTHGEAREAIRVAASDLKPPRVLYAEPDGRERLNYAYRVLPSITRRKVS
jgi:hypothetical protein